MSYRKMEEREDDDFFEEEDVGTDGTVRGRMRSWAHHGTLESSFLARAKILGEVWLSAPK